MEKFDVLLKAFAEQPIVKRYKELEQKIHQDKGLLEKYQSLKELQKKMVNAQARQQTNKEIENAYNTMHEELLEHPLMGEYLDIVEMINSDLQMIQDIIATEINMDL